VAVTPRSFRATPGAHHDRLTRHGLTPVYPPHDRILSADELASLVTGCAALIVGLDPVTAAVLDAGPLRVVVKYGSGMDNIDLDAARGRGVRVGGTPGANARSVAELTMALLLSLARHVCHHDRAVRADAGAGAARGAGRRTGIELRGRVLGLIGLGAVGHEVATLAAAFGMRVLAHDPFVHSGDVETVGLAELLARADAVSLHAPLTDATRAILGADALRRMRPGALLVNTARAELVDDEQVAAALSDGTLGGAALDVFTAGSPLLRLDNVIASPHAGAATVEAVERTGVAAVDEVYRLLRDAC
jgi:D-3-phosphoglycerate dehydrogenase